MNLPSNSTDSNRIASEAEATSADIAALTQQSELLEALLESTSDCVYFKDRKSRFIWISNTMAENFELESPEQAIDKTDFDFFTEEHARPAYEDEQRIIATGKPILDFVEKETWPNGRITWASTSKMPLRNGAGEIIGTFGISRDVTPKKEAERSLAYERDLFSIFLDSIPDRIYFKDLESKYVRCSKAMAKEFGLADGREIKGKSAFNFFSEEYAKTTYEIEKNIIESRETVEGVIDRESWKDGRESWILSTKLPWTDKNGNVIGTIGISKDLTSVKESEKELNVINQQLVEASRHAGMAEIATGILHNVGNVLNSANVSLSVIGDAIKQSKVDTFAKVNQLISENSHDLPTFFAENEKGKQIPGFLSKLSDRLVSDKHKLLAEVDDLAKGINHIKEIISMQQSYARVSSPVETLKVSDLFTDALHIHKGAFDRHKIRIERDFADLKPIKVDKHRVLQILVNLLHNAKYACDESDAEDKIVTIRTLSDKEDHVTLEVEDNGVGIAEENLERIFRHGFTTREKGHGFGLHSCAISAEDIGGTLSVRSDGLGHGAVFSLVLPTSPKSVNGESVK